MKITNQKPAVLSPVYHDRIAQPYDPPQFLMDTVTKPVFTPITTGVPVSVINNKTALTEDDVNQIILNCLGDNFDAQSESMAKSILGQTLVNFNAASTLNVNLLFLIQSGTAANLPEPSSNVVYTPSQDIIPNARKFLAGICDYDTFFASLAYYARPKAIGFYFATDACFDNFKTWFASQIAMLGSVLSNDTNKLCADLQTLTLNELTEALLLRNTESENCEPNSFARLIISMLMTYTKVVGPGEFGVLPFTLSELYNPTTLIFVNIEAHSKASAKKVADEWNMIKNATKQKPKMVSNNKLNRLTATQRNLQKVAQAAATASKTNMNAQRAARMRFKQTEPTTIDLARIIRKIMDRMSFVNKSMNTYRQVKTSYARANRRDPDDYNKMGKITSVKYKPDIHLYIDTSGSISERNYQDTVKACIAMAKKLNINMYFNSFSHVLSQTTKLTLENRSKAQIYGQFRKVPKVTGGTDYTQIWHFINQSKKRRSELSIIITDFEFDAPNEYIKHPKHLYYVPCSQKDWDMILHYAKNFAMSMLHNDPDIRKHILF